MEKQTQEENKSLPIDEKSREDFCLWYYAQSQPLDANIVFDHFKRYYRNLPSIEAAQERIDYLENKLMLMEKTTVNSTPASIQEDKFVDRLFTNLNKLGYDTSNCDGDTDPAEIIAHWIDCLVKDSQPQPLQEEGREISSMSVNRIIEEYKKQDAQKEICTCTTDQTTGHTAGKCNVCGKEVEETAIQHADSLHKKGSSELAGNGKLTENDCWENAYFNFKEGSKVKKVEVKWEENMK